MKSNCEYEFAAPPLFSLIKDTLSNVNISACTPTGISTHTQIRNLCMYFFINGVSKIIYRYLNITRVSYVEENDVSNLLSLEHSLFSLIQNSVATKSFLNSPEIKTKSPDDTFSNCL